ncbi:MAG: hypothetical protein QOG88_959 [Actinomycetota bacterium]|nr:hypothetical protein [Actinomycetota bacterium]
MEQAARAREIADRYWDELLALEPMLGTMSGDERFDDRLPDPGPDGRAASETIQRRVLADIEALDTTGLDEVMRTTVDVVEAIALRYLAAAEHRTDLLAPASHWFGPASVLAEIGSLQQADTPERLDRLEARLRAIPAFIEATQGVAEEGIARGVTSPRVVAERAVAQLERIMALGSEDSPALAQAKDNDARTRLAGVIAQVVNPAYERYVAFLREGYLPHATETIGLSALPGGDAMYSAEVLASTTLPMDPQEIHDLGHERFDAIQEERAEIAKRLGYASAKEAVAAHVASGKDSIATKDELKALAEEQVRRSWDAAPAFFGRLPSTWCEVQLVEEFREADMAFAFYNAPTADGSRPGVYYVNGFDLGARERHGLASVTYHEAHPGHHFQIALEQETEDRPAVRRFGGFMAGSAFCEGWGLYSERLADEMGLYVDDWERMGMLEAQAHRAGRLITDTGIHALGWGRERSIEKLVEGGVSPSDAVIEIDRYIAMPAQALSYMIGMIEIQKAREAAEAREGSAFSLKDFHDRVLSLGQLPLPALRRELG